MRRLCVVRSEGGPQPATRQFVTLMGEILIRLDVHCGSAGE